MRQGLEGDIAEVLVRRNELEKMKVDLKITLLGDHYAGKSTLIGVLVSGKKDNGKGLARNNVFRHKHEIINGSTSSISHQVLGFDSKGRVTNSSRLGELTIPEIVESSSKIITFIDVAGHQKYIKTLIAGIYHTDLALVVISALEGVTPTTKEHFKLAFTFQKAVVVIVTKVDAV